MSKNGNPKISIDNLVGDDDFVKHCLEPDEVSIAFWETWIKENPGNESVFQDARAEVMLLHRAQKDQQNKNSNNHIWNHIERHIDEGKVGTTVIGIRRHWKSIAMVAASVLILFTAYRFISTDKTNDAHWLVSTNTTKNVKSIFLSDGSTIDLAPGSTIRYVEGFRQEAREILLEGEAFFSVKRDTLRPFRVFANETITEVLGTSFSIKTDEEDHNVEIAVVTGKVAVYSHTSDGTSADSPPIIANKGNIRILKPNTKLYLTPNEKVTYSFKERHIEKSVVDKPRMLGEGQQTSLYKFENAPVTEVLSKLEAAYGIAIRYDQNALANCSISTQLDDAPMFTKLKMICTALDLRFTENNAIIYIEGAGCK